MADTYLSSRKALSELSDQVARLYSEFYLPQAIEARDLAISLMRDTGRAAAERGLSGLAGLAPRIMRDIRRRQSFGSPEARRQALRAAQLLAARGSSTAGLQAQLANRAAAARIFSELGGQGAAAARLGLNSILAADAMRRQRLQAFNNIMAGREKRAQQRLQAGMALLGAAAGFGIGSFYSAPLLGAQIGATVGGAAGGLS